MLSIHSYLAAKKKFPVFGQLAENDRNSLLHCNWLLLNILSYNINISIHILKTFESISLAKKEKTNNESDR